MSFTMAVIADTHLPAVPGSAQEACLDWALTALCTHRPSLVVVAGDVTAAGSEQAARSFRRRIDQCGLPFLITPGNSDLRSPSHRKSVRRALSGPSVADCEGCRVVMLDTSEGSIAPEARNALTRAAQEARDTPLVLVTHCPPDSLAPDSAQWCETWLRWARPALVVVAHSHRDRHYEFGGVPVHMVRGLDPDKAIGGSPAVALLEMLQRAWQRTDLDWPGGTVGGWTPAERTELADLLGLACSRDIIGGLQRAAAHVVPCVELRATAAAAESEALGDEIRRWRASGGRLLSWHMPDLPWHEDGAPAAELAGWGELLQLGLQHGAGALTVHVPRAPVGALQPGSRPWRDLAASYCRMLAPAVAAGVRVNIENMHMTAREAPDASRRYGYLPVECLAWVDELQSRLGEGAVWMLLDLGHARNNDPFASEFTLGTWYALVGRRTGGYHLHQVVSTDGRMVNHQPIADLHGPLISFSSFLWGWRSGQLNHAPVFIEVPGAEGQVASLETFRRALRP